jgi:hypothetical protein
MGTTGNMGGSMMGTGIGNMVCGGGNVLGTWVVWWEPGGGLCRDGGCFGCRCSYDASSAFGVLSMIPAPSFFFFFASLSKVLPPFFALGKLRKRVV